MNIGEKIKYLREKSNLSQRQLSILLNVEPATISRYELNIRVPNIKTVKQLANIFNVTTDYLLGIENNVEEVHSIKNFIERYKENNELYFNLYIKITEENMI